MFPGAIWELDSSRPPFIMDVYTPEDNDLDRTAKDLLVQYLSPTARPKLSTQAAAARVNALFDLHNPNEQEEGFMATLDSEIFGNIASYIPHNDRAQDKLVDLAEAIQQLPLERHRPIWPLFCYSGELAEMYTGEWDLGIEMFSRSETRSTISKKCWRNFNAYCARLTGRRICDLSQLALWSLRDALEGDPEPTGPPDTMLEVAADWLKYAGPVLLANKSDFGRQAKGGKLWNGMGGFCRQRWALWKDRLHEIARQFPTWDPTHRLAMQAAAVIDMSKVRSVEGPGSPPGSNSEEGQFELVIHSENMIVEGPLPDREDSDDDMSD